MPRFGTFGSSSNKRFGLTSGKAAVSASYLIVAGGGAGGGGLSSVSGGGGGAGGYLTGTTSLVLTTSYTVTVGAGGATASASSGNQGSNSQFGTLTASVGGGGGGGFPSGTQAGQNGGSGGGANGYSGGSFSGGTATSGQGNNGGVNFSSANYGSGGGGGAGAVGSAGTTSTNGAGGAGTASSISGSSVTYAGGGGGGGWSSNSTGGAGGTGGGGGGGNNNSNGTAGTANTGGGGGGAGVGSATTSGSGGSGIVIISYLGAQQFGGGVVTSVGGNTIHTFNTSGTLSPLTTLSASYLIVAGGGSGGINSGGGGGAGGYQTSSVTIDTNSTYTITVGAGGAATSGSDAGPAVIGSQGSNSSFSAYATASVGGGFGGAPSGAAAGTGGSGGGSGGGTTSTAGSATSGQGNAGGGPGGGASNYASSGGGGAGAVGGNATSTTGGNGGAGTASSISGSSVTYAGGGGGGVATSGTSAGTGGTGGGGAGLKSSGTATSGTVNTGGGGGGCGGGAGGTDTSGAGGSGIVIISYAGSTQQMAGGSVTITGGNVIHTFLSSGYLTPITYVSNSLRFRGVDGTHYLSRTLTQTGSQTKMTLSVWFKKSGYAGAMIVPFIQGTNADYTVGDFNLGFRDGDVLFGNYYTGVNNFIFDSNAKLRDPAAWYHVVYAFDTTQATDTNRMKVYLNGTQVTFSAATYPSQNYNIPFLVAGYQLRIGISSAAPSARYFDGYMAEYNFIDGQALTPNSFGTFNSYGVWQPITYGGSYGTNGFYLPFTNKTSTTTLGYDFSPNGNHWTTSGISLTAGATYDSMTDVPTLTSNTASNYCVLNPLNIGSASSLSNGSLTFSSTSVVNSIFQSQITGTFGVSSGKWYWEFIQASAATSGPVLGIALTTRLMSSSPFGAGAGGVYVYSGADGHKNNGAADSAYGASFTNNDVIGIALDMDAGTLVFYKNNTSQGTAFTGISGTYMPYFINNGSGETTTGHFNFGQRPFTYTAPAGYVALNTYNL